MEKFVVLHKNSNQIIPYTFKVLKMQKGCIWSNKHMVSNIKTDKIACVK